MGLQVRSLAAAVVGLADMRHDAHWDMLRANQGGIPRRRKRRSQPKRRAIKRRQGKRK